MYRSTFAHLHNEYGTPARSETPATVAATTGRGRRSGRARDRRWMLPNPFDWARRPARTGC